MGALVTGVQTCALPICPDRLRRWQPDPAPGPEAHRRSRRSPSPATTRLFRPKMRLSSCPPSPVTGSFASFTQLKATRGAMFWRPHRNLLDCSIKRNIDCKDDTKSIDFRQGGARSEEHTSELQSLMRTSYAVFCLKKKTIY